VTMASCRLLGLATLFLFCVPTNGKGTCKAGDSTRVDETDMILSTAMYQKKIGAHKATSDPVAADPVAADPPAESVAADPVAADPVAADPPADPAATPPAESVAADRVAALAADAGAPAALGAVAPVAPNPPAAEPAAAVPPATVPVAPPAAAPVVPSAASAVKGRVWMVCKGAVQAAQTEEIAGFEPAREMHCTAQMPFRELCCAPWSSMTFPDSVTSPVFNAPKADVSLLAISPPKEILKICTTQTSQTDMMKAAGVTVGTVTGECINKTFTMDILLGKGDGATADEQNLKPGEIVLRERILWFLEQGIPAENVPTCAKEVSACAGGQTVLTVEESWIKQAAGSLAAAKATQSLIQGQSFAPASDADSKTQNLKILARSLSFAGALMTSGSFTMMAAQGGI